MIVSVVLSQLQDGLRSLLEAHLGYGLHKMIPPQGYLAMVDLSEDDHEATPKRSNWNPWFFRWWPSWRNRAFESRSCDVRCGRWGR